MKIAEQLTQILSQGVSGNQAQLAKLLHDKGVKATQSSVSRALKKINAVKGLDEYGKTIYTLPRLNIETGQIGPDSSLFGTLVHKILDNGQMIVVHTRPGTAPTVAKVIDDQAFEQIMGTVAGDDTIFIAPLDTRQTRQLANRLRSYLTGVGLF